MTKLAVGRPYRGPFHPNSVRRLPGSRLTAVRRALESCHIDELHSKILHKAFAYFKPADKTVVYAAFWAEKNFTGYTYSKNENAPLQAAGIVEKRAARLGDGRVVHPEYPIRPDLVEDAKKTKDIIPGKSNGEEFLAVPLVSRKRREVFGVLLLSNLRDGVCGEFTKADAREARAFAELASEVIIDRR